MKETVTFSPFTRVEGDLHISVEIVDGVVTDARATGTLFRGFEGILRGREPADAVVLTPRICGQCGASHANAAATALAHIAGLEAPPNGVRCRNMIQAVEAILNNLTHFYLSFAVDLAHPRYGEAMARRFAPVEGTSFREAIRARKSFLATLGLLAGKWPNSLAVQPGGVTKTLTPVDLSRLRGILNEFREFVEGRMIGGPLETFLDLGSVEDLEAWADCGEHAQSDVGCFIAAARQGGLDGIGRGPSRFLSAGGYPLVDGAPPPSGANPSGPGAGVPQSAKPGRRAALFAAGYYDGALSGFSPEAVTEHARFAWLEAEPGGRHPLEGVTHPAPEKTEAYTWCKAPRYGGQSAEVGPLARAVVAGLPLARDLLARSGPSVYARMLLRLREAILLLSEVNRWLGGIDPEEPFCVPTPRIEEGTGVGLVPAPRGMLGHWVRVEKGRIRNYQVVTPTGWNLSPRDSEGRPGPVEEALVGTPVETKADAVNVAHVIRSFDPCLFCTVH